MQFSHHLFMILCLENVEGIKNELGIFPFRKKIHFLVFWKLYFGWNEIFLEFLVHNECALNGLSRAILAHQSEGIAILAKAI